MKLRRFTVHISDPVKFRRLNGWLVIFWGVMFPVSIITGLLNVVAYIAILSLYANFATHLGVWAASRAEVAVEAAEAVDSAGDTEAGSGAARAVPFSWYTPAKHKEPE